MRRITDKKTALRAMILSIALILLLSIWPLRVWTGVESYPTGGELVETSEYINFEKTVVQRFVIQYKRLSSIDFYLSEMELGRYITLSIMDENANEVFRSYVDVEGLSFPGYVSVPVELNAEVGKEYYLVLQSCRSKYYVGYETVPDDSQYVGSLFYAHNEVPGRHLKAIYSYRIPLDKIRSLIIMLIIAVFAAIGYCAIGLYYEKRNGKNEIMSVGKAVRMIANPILALVFGSLMIMVFPLKFFDVRATDIIFYEVGLGICAFLAFYAVNHNIVKREVGVSFWQSVADRDKVVYVPMMFCIAMTIWHASNYMNDLYDIYHTLSARRMVIWLLLLMMFTFLPKELFNPANILWVLISVIAGIWYYSTNAVPVTENEYDLKNAALKYGVIIAVLLGSVVISLLRHFVKNCIFSAKEHDEVKNTKIIPSAFGIMLLVLFVMMIVFRNTRWWGATKAVLFLLLYLRLALFRGRDDWYKILSGGLMVNFAISLAFSLLHRYFPGYVSGRFGFIFHTVTVTAEYLIIMGAVSTVMLVTKIVGFPKKGGVINLFKSAWKEMTLFGWIMAYAIFTVSRTAYVSIILCVLCVLGAVMLKHKGQFIRIVCTMLAAVIVCFPAAFTLQRIVPVVVADPVFYLIDDADAQVRGGSNWGNPNYMCVERFAGLFANKILGMDLGNYFYPVDKYNYDSNGNALYDDYGYPVDESNEDGYYMGWNEESADKLLASAGFTHAEFEMLLSDIHDYVDESNALDVISNGRITIFRSYLKNMNLTGHDVMGAELPGGEIALHAHNTYIQVAYDHGVIVGIIFALVIISAIIFGLKIYTDKKNKDPLNLIVFAISVGFVVAGTTEWVFHLCNPMTIALMMSFAGIVGKKIR